MRRFPTAGTARATRRLLGLAAVSLAAAAGSATSAAAQVADLFGDVPEIANYRMTEPALEGFIRATLALKALEDAGDVDIGSRFEVEEPADLSLDGIAAEFDREPRIRQAIEGAGMSSREYVTFLMAMIQAAMGAMMLEFGGERAPGDQADSAVGHNIRFFLEHREAFEALDG
jgi:hypothetical protein